MAHVVEVHLEVDRGDVVSRRYIGVTHYVVIQYVLINWLKHTDELFFQCLLHGGICSVSLNILLPDVASCADLGRCSIHVGCGPPWGWWSCPTCWSDVRCWSYHGLRGARYDEAQVSQGASSQVCFDCSRVRLKILPGDVNILVVWLALNFWEYWVRESVHNVLDSGILHVDLLGVLECLSVLLMRKPF
jgi:hypothetical protein